MTRGRSRKGDPFSAKRAAQDTDATKLENIAYAALHKATILPDGAWNGRWVTYFEWAKLAGMELFSTTPRGSPLWTKGYVERITMNGLNKARKVVPLLHYRACVPRKPLEQRPGYRPEPDKPKPDRTVSAIADIILRVFHEAGDPTSVWLAERAAKEIIDYLTGKTANKPATEKKNQSNERHP